MSAGGWALAAVLVGGCGDNDLGIPRQTLVEDLSEADALGLCAEFVAHLCWDRRRGNFCNVCVEDFLCTQPETVVIMDVACAGITVGQVRDCAQGIVDPYCERGGGCMFAVGEFLCPN